MLQKQCKCRAICSLPGQDELLKLGLQSNLNSTDLKYFQIFIIRPHIVFVQK